MIEGGFEALMNNLQQGIASRSASMASFNYEFHSNSSDRKRSDFSNDESKSNENSA